MKRSSRNCKLDATTHYVPAIFTARRQGETTVKMTVKIGDATCPHCDYPNTCMSGPDLPEQGDLAICFQCRNVAIIDVTLQGHIYQRKPRTLAERKDAAEVFARADGAT